MSRGVPPWLWIVLARDHGPRNSSVRLVMHTLRTYMDKEGYTFVSQPKIVLASCLSKPTVRRALEILWRGKWVGVAFHFERSGQDWRGYEYRSCIPDEVIVPDAHEMLRLAHASTFGDVDTDTHPYLTKVGKPVVHLDHKVGKPVAHLNGQGDPQSVEGGQIDVPKVGKSTTKVGKPVSEGGQIDVPKVGNSATPKYYSENSVSNQEFNSSLEEAHALPRMCAPLGHLNGTKSNAEEPEVIREDKAAKMFQSDPDFPIAKAAVMFKLPEKKVLRIQKLAVRKRECALRASRRH